MTTIAWDGQTLAADTLATWGNGRDGYCTKILRRGQILAGASGSVAGCQAFLDWVREGCEDEAPVPPVENGEWFGLVIMPDNTILTRTPMGWERTTAAQVSMGSGSGYAKGAMSAGADARRAVEIAIEHDTRSGGEITVLTR